MTNRRMTDKPDFPMALDSTMISSFRACPHLYWMQYFRHYKPFGKSVDLIAGGAFAAGVETVRKEIWNNGATPQDALSLGVITLIKHWGDFEAPEKHNKQLERMVEALEEYFKHYGYKTDAITPFMQNGKGAIEFSFAIPIPGTSHPTTGEPILYSGRFDMMGLYNKQIFVVDEKTTTSLGNQWLNNWRMRSQITAYCWAAREYGYPVAGAIIRGIAILKTKFGHAESIQYRPDWFIDRWLEQVARDVARMIQAWEEGIWDYDLDGACTTYGGCRFADVCSSRDEERVLRSQYKRVVWDPLAKEEIELGEED